MAAQAQVVVVIPNWNGIRQLPACLNSLFKQSAKCDIVVVDNGSSDGSVAYIEKNYPSVIVIENLRNLGFAGGVNTGIRYALAKNYEFIALLNNDAVADKSWLGQLLAYLKGNPKTGIVTSKIVSANKDFLDSTGELYSIWGLPFPRGRGETKLDKYDDKKWVMGASGGASLYRESLFQQIGLFDEDFFAYFEDVDLSWRAQLAGWKIAFEPKSVVYHEIGATGGKIKGFYTYHTLKNLPLLLWKDLPWPLLRQVWPRLSMAYFGFMIKALLRGQVFSLLKGLCMGSFLWPKKMIERRCIQKSRVVSIEYLDSLITRDLPPGAKSLRSVRVRWWKLRGKHG